MQCHNQRSLSTTLPNGETLPLYVDPQVYATSVHGDKLLCADCHSTISDYPHIKREVQSRREYNLAQYELCKKCHFDNYTKTLDSIHYEMLASGDMKTPLCTAIFVSSLRLSFISCSAILFTNHSLSIPILLTASPKISALLRSIPWIQ